MQMSCRTILTAGKRQITLILNLPNPFCGIGDEDERQIPASPGEDNAEI